jgi:hypothetical protein
MNVTLSTDLAGVSVGTAYSMTVNLMGASAGTAASVTTSTLGVIHALTQHAGSCTIIPRLFLQDCWPPWLFERLQGMVQRLLCH